ncbi:hypothetical protein [Reyranella sp.]|uniref:hypothetical protein n=1 Tax=Reyranella sp. TaxID=1929291 RepID=UPI003D1417A1
MTGQPDNQILSLLLDIRDSMQRMEGKLDEFFRRPSPLATKRAQFHVDLAAHAARMDRMDERLDRIEKRFNLVDA